MHQALTGRAARALPWTWAGFYTIILLSWMAMLAMQADPALVEAARAGGAGFWKTLCLTPAGEASLPGLLAMWALMSAAMMAPTAIPAFRTFDELSHTGATTRGGLGLLMVGHGLAWLGFAVAAALAQFHLSRAGFLSPLGASLDMGLTVGLLSLAGLYQFSPLKQACLARCRHPLTFFLAHWRAGGTGALVMGLRLGLVCVGCCWALMLLGFVGGVMNLAWMGAALVLMTLEKTQAGGRLVTVPLGALLLAAAAWTAAGAL